MAGMRGFLWACCCRVRSDGAEFRCECCEGKWRLLAGLEEIRTTMQTGSLVGCYQRAASHPCLISELQKPSGPDATALCKSGSPDRPQSRHGHPGVPRISTDGLGAR